MICITSVWCNVEIFPNNKWWKNIWSNCRIPRNSQQLHLRVEMLCKMRHNTIDTFVIQQNGNKLQGVLQFSRIFSFVGSLMTLAHNLFLVGFTFGENDMFWSPTLLSSTSSLSPDPVNSGMLT